MSEADALKIVMAMNIGQRHAFGVTDDKRSPAVAVDSPGRRKTTLGTTSFHKNKIRTCCRLVNTETDVQSHLLTNDQSEAEKLEVGSRRPSPPVTVICGRRSEP